MGRYEALHMRMSGSLFVSLATDIFMVLTPKA